MASRAGRRHDLLSVSLMFIVTEPPVSICEATSSIIYVLRYKWIAGDRGPLTVEHRLERRQQSSRPSRRRGQGHSVSTVGYITSRPSAAIDNGAYCSQPAKRSTTTSNTARCRRQPPHSTSGDHICVRPNGRHPRHRRNKPLMVVKIPVSLLDTSRSHWLRCAQGR